MPNDATTDKHGVHNLGICDMPRHLNKESGVDCSSANHNGHLRNDNGFSSMETR